MNDSTSLEELQEEFNEFKLTSQALEQELEAELAETDERRQELEHQLEQALLDVEFWRNRAEREQKEAVKIQESLAQQTDALRQAVQRNQDQLMAVERENDDMERSGREIEATIRNLEHKNAELLERLAIQEAESREQLIMSEELQRARDDLKEAQDEIHKLKLPKPEPSLAVPKSNSLKRMAGIIDQVSLLEGRVATVGRRLVSDGSFKSSFVLAQPLDLRTRVAAGGHGRPLNS